jgi:uncharacterized integral membrane protein
MSERDGPPDRRGRDERDEPVSLPGQGDDTRPVPGFDDTRPEIPWRIGLILLIGALVVVFAVQNTQDVSIVFLGWQWTMPLVIVILVTVILAVLADEVVGGILRRRRSRRRRERDELQRLRDIQ